MSVHLLQDRNPESDRLWQSIVLVKNSQEYESPPEKRHNEVIPLLKMTVKNKTPKLLGGSDREIWMTRLK